MDLVGDESTKGSNLFSSQVMQLRSLVSVGLGGTIPQVISIIVIIVMTRNLRKMTAIMTTMLFSDVFFLGQSTAEPVLHHHGASGDHHRVVRHQHAPSDKGTFPTPFLSILYGQILGDQWLP